MSRRTIFTCGFITVLAVALSVAAAPRDVPPNNLFEPACRMDGRVGTNPKSVKAGEFQITGTYVPPAGATKFSVSVLILDTCTEGNAVGWANHPATVDEAKKTWSATVANQMPDREVFVGVRIGFTLEGSQMEQPPQELRCVRIKGKD